MSSKKHLLPIGLLILIAALPVLGGEGVLIVKFDCQGPVAKLAGPLVDSLAANLKIQQVPVVSRDRWHSLLTKGGFLESDMNYNPMALAQSVKTLDARGAVYGQVYKKDGLLIMDAHYIEPGFDKPIDFDPMIGYIDDDVLDMAWDLAVHLARPDKSKPNVVAVEPTDSAVINGERMALKVYFDEPMNPDSYGLTGEPKDMFFTYGDVLYDQEANSFTFNVHLYPNLKYRLWVNGPGVKPFMDTTGNVANPYQWNIITK